MRCPYVECSQELKLSPEIDACACEYRHPVVICPGCGTACRGAARYCRACRRTLSEDSLGSGAAPGPLEFLFYPGTFLHPAKPAAGFLWGVSVGGEVVQLSTRTDAKPRVWARLKSTTAGLNRFAIVSPPHRAEALGGPLLLIPDASSVYAVRLANGEIATLYRSTDGAEIVANQVEADSILQRGIAATDEFCCFLQRTPGAQQATLVVHYFDPRKAVEKLMTVEGGSYVGPAVSGEWVAVCSDRVMGAYNTADQTSVSYALPNSFTPSFSRSSTGVNVAPGAIPLALHKGAEGLEAWVEGLHEGSPGLLQVRFEKQYHDFIPLPAGSCISNGEEGGLCVNRLDSAEFFGMERPRVRFAAMQAGMPIFASYRNTAYFNRSRTPGSHRVSLMAGSIAELSFDDQRCNEDSCCGVQVVGRDVVISYLIFGNAPADRGIKLARWRFSNPQ